MSRRSKSELVAQLRKASNHIAELETARLRAETLFAVTQALGKTLSLQDTFETILGQLQRVVPYDSSSVQVIQDNRLVIVGGRGFANPQDILGVGFDLEDETNPSIQVLRSKRQHVFGDVPITRILRASSTVVDAFADGSARRSYSANASSASSLSTSSNPTSTTTTSPSS